MGLFLDSLHSKYTAFSRRRQPEAGLIRCDAVLHTAGFDPDRITQFFGVENFGLVDLDWGAEEVTLTLLGNEGQTYAAHTYAW
mgnify:CR=1 FL=1